MLLAIVAALALGAGFIIGLHSGIQARKADFELLRLQLVLGGTDRMKQRAR